MPGEPFVGPEKAELEAAGPDSEAGEEIDQV
jgi:hypothetical protein